MAVVTMLRRIPEPPADEETVVPPTTQGLLWATLAADIATVVWMIRTGSWLDTASPVLSVVTLGGHHRIVLALASVGLLLLALLAPLSHGFTRATATQRILLPVAGVVSVAALAGLLSLVLIGTAAVLVLAVLLGVWPRARIDVIQRRR